MRVETSIAASHGGLLIRWTPPVSPVVPGAGATPSVMPPATSAPHRPAAAHQLAAAIAASTGIDATGLSLRARHAVHAYSTVRDGDRREYLHRVFGLEDRA